MDCYDYNARVFHNNESTPTDISTLLTTLSLLGISISTILCYSSYFGLTKSNYFCLGLHSAFPSIINFGGWISGLLSGGVCPAPVSLFNIHKPYLSVYVRTSEILYIVNIQKYKLRMLTNTPNPNTFFDNFIIYSTMGNFRPPHLTRAHVYN